MAPPSQQPQPAAGQLWRWNDTWALSVVYFFAPECGVRTAEIGRSTVKTYSDEFLRTHATYLGEIAALPELIEAANGILALQSQASMFRFPRNCDELKALLAALAHAHRYEAIDGDARRESEKRRR